MDIDSPPTDTYVSGSPTHAHLHLPSFSSSFPLPFRVLFLVGLAQLLWAVNLHVLHLLGLDTSWILDVRNDDDDGGGGGGLEAGGSGGGVGDDGGGRIEGGDQLEDDVELAPLDSLRPHPVSQEPDTPTRPISAIVSRPSSSRLYGPVYKVFVVYTAWCGAGWTAFRLATQDDLEAMERSRWLVGLVILGPIIGALTPWRGVGERERRALRRAVKRILWPPINSPIFFSDIILADILTSFAKVLGDLWISACQILLGGITHGRVAQSGWSQWVTLGMVCLPYVLRFRQCMLELYQSGWKSPRPLANALKYFSAFPVIFLSAAQKTVVREIAEIKGVSVQELGDTSGRWFGEHPVFRLWFLAVVVNSLFSFYWDVEKDWGLALCEIDTWLPPIPQQSSTGNYLTPSRGGSPVQGAGRRESVWARLKRSVSSRGSLSPGHQRSPCPTPVPFDGALSPTASRSGFMRFGLRQTLLLPDPMVYYLFTLIDLVLRFTWSLKLSSHLHTISEIESGVFMMEALELVRRWMWVFVRIEWEGVKMGEMARWRAGRERGAVVWEQGKDDMK